MTWTILTLFLTHMSDSYATGNFKTQQACITALHQTQSEMIPSARQCIRVDEKDLTNYKNR